MRVLIVDDNHSVRRALQVMLEALGHEVAGIAVDGKEGLEMYEKLQPDFVFLDVQMPNLNGLDSLRELLSGHKDASVIVYTGGKSCSQEAHAIGAVGYLEKPFGLDALVQQIAKVNLRRAGSLPA